MAEKGAERMLSGEIPASVLDKIPTGIYCSDFSGTFLYGNRMAEEIIGYKREEIVGKNFLKLNLLSPKDMLRATKLLAMNRAGKPTGPDEFMLKRKDGSKRIVEITTNVVDIDGKKIVFGMVEDITGRKNMERELRESEEKYRFLLEGTQEMILVLSRSGKVLFINNNTLKKLGYGKEEVVGKSVANFLSKGSIKKALYALAQEFLGRPQKAMEVEVKEKSGGLRTFRISEASTPVHENGKMTGILITGYDITEQRKNEEDIRKSEEKFRNIFGEMPDAAVILDMKGTLLESSREAERLSGYSKEELIGKNLFLTNILDTKSKAIAVKSLALRFSGKGSPNLSLVIRKKDGKRIPLEINSQIIDYMGKKAALIILRDVSDRERVEKELRESEKRLNDILMSSADWIWEVGRDGKYTFASGKVKEIMGYSPGEIIGKTPFDLMEKEEANRVRKVFQETMSKKKPITDLENWNVRKDRRKVCLLTNGTPITDEKGNILGYRGVDKDITERKIREEELKTRADELEKFSKLGVGRELRMIELKKRIRELEDKLKERRP